MASLRIERVVALPETLTASTMYIVRGGEGMVELVMTGTDVNEVRRVLDKNDVQVMINSAVGNLSNIVVVQDIEARNALSPSTTTLALVMNATGDPTVSEGAALYIYAPVDADWVKVAEYESLDLSLEWAAIQNRPASTVADIDKAVEDTHVHDNKSVLDELADDDGTLKYKGAALGTNIAVTEW